MKIFIATKRRQLIGRTTGRVHFIGRTDPHNYRCGMFYKQRFGFKK